MAVPTDRSEVSRLEVVETGRRRRWTEGEKLRIVAESLSGLRLVVSLTARRHGISRSLLTAWRRQFRVQVPADAEGPGFVPAVVVPEAPAKSAPALTSSRMEIVSTNGRRIIIDTGLDVAALGRVPHRGTAPMLTDLIGGQVQVAFDPLPASIQYIKAGKLRALAVTTVARSEALPDIPSVSEYVPGFVASNWYGVGAPQNTPAEIIGKLNTEINAAQDESTARGVRRYAIRKFARRLHEVCRRRHREVGEGD
jgi:transposase-like protein